MLKKKRIEKKEYHQHQQQQPEFKIESDSYDNEIKVPIKRVQHPFRYLSLFRNTAADPAGKEKVVIINPPKPEPNKDTEVYKKALYWSKRVTLAGCSS